MGFFDDMTSVVNRGTASVQRTGRSTQLKMQLNELMKQRKELAAQLGASLYDTVKSIPEMREGREPIFEGIKGIDEQRAAIEAEIAKIEAEAAAQLEASMTFKCPNCGSVVSSGDLFCCGCGSSVAEMKASMQKVEGPTSGPTCVSCGASINNGDLFCMKCGVKQE